MTKKPPAIALTRAYDPQPRQRGYRALVDRVWPRGVKKADLALDAWFKDLAPSTELRRWFNHQPERWEKFRERYFQELESKADELEELLAVARQKRVLLIYGARDTEHNNAVALRDFLLAKLAKDS